MRDILRIIMAVTGGALALVGLALAALWAVAPFIWRDNSVATNTLIAGGAALGLLYGLLLFVQAFRGQDATAPWPPVWILLLLWAGVLIIGTLNLAGVEGDTFAAWVFPPLHVLAVALPVMALLAIGAQRSRAPAGRLAVQFAYGGTAAFLLSLGIEVGLLLALGAIAAALFGPGASLMTFVQSLVSGNLAVLGDLRAAPALLTLVIVARVLLVPLVEEAAKALTIPWWAGWEPGQARALAWGLAAGLGFALTEGLLVMRPALEAGVWWPSLLGLAGAALVQGMCAALVGVMWWRGQARRRPLNLVIGYLVAVALHAFWNMGGIARALVANIPPGPTATQEPAYDVFAADIIGVVGAALLLVLLAALLIRLTARPRWLEEGTGD
ncbi:MAG: PrsW family intramembrane metalloprotease [Anaerolineae bacterium]|nr:PrsW family intramembrane metalloprotease [Anaerolineae bacterium]